MPKLSCVMIENLGQANNKIKCLEHTIEHLRKELARYRVVAQNSASFQLPSLEECIAHVNQQIWCGCAKGTSESIIELLYNFMRNNAKIPKKI